MYGNCKKVQPLATRFIACTFGLLIIVLLFTSACDSVPTGTLPNTEPFSANANLPHEGFQLNNPLAFDNIRFEHISVQDGISQNDAIAILQDSYGFMCLS